MCGIAGEVNWKVGIDSDNVRRLFEGIDHRGPGDFFVKIDIAAMHYGLEARSPFLDQDLKEFCAQLPIDLKVNGGIGKYLIKKVSERYFPKYFIYRKKMGFSIPLEKWLRGALKETLYDVLENPNIMAPLNIDEINKVLNEFYIMGLGHASRIWALLMFGLWKIECAGGVKK